MLIGLQHGLPYMGIKSDLKAVELLFSQVGCQLLQSTLQILAGQPYLRHVTAPPFSSPPLGSLALATPLTPPAQRGSWAATGAQAALPGQRGVVSVGAGHQLHLPSVRGWCH